MPSGHLCDGRIPGRPWGSESSWQLVEHGSGAWTDGGEDSSQAAVVPRREGASGISERSGLV